MVLPNEERIRWLLAGLGRLHAGGAEPVSGLVLPNGSFFPDSYDGSPRSLDRLARRMLRHAGLGDVAVTIAIAMPQDADGGGGCSSGACATPKPERLERVERAGDGYRIQVAAGELGHPTVLTTALARAAAGVFLREADLERAASPVEAAIDLAGVLLGFGVLLCNGSHIVAKGCGGPRVHSATHLPLDLLALALAIHCRLFGVAARKARSELDRDPRETFRAAEAWADANRAAIALVRDDPALLIDGAVPLKQPGGLWSRLFGPRRDDPEMPPELVQPERERARPIDPARAERLAALRELVDESLEADRQ